MDKRDALVLTGIVVGVSIPLTLVMLIANGILENPIP
jgi:multisubunit Na+/H+ antiporter MnhC subunit